MKNDSYKECKNCGQVRYIVNRTKCLCDDCNYKRLHKGMSRLEVKRQQAHPNKHNKRRKTGELALFKEIWGERSHICTHCGKVLLEPLKPAYFSHIKSKGAFPNLRLEKSNIELVCMECHQKYEFGIRKNKDYE